MKTSEACTPVPATNKHRQQKSKTIGVNECRSQLGPANLPGFGFPLLQDLFPSLLSRENAYFYPPTKTTKKKSGDRMRITTWMRQAFGTLVSSSQGTHFYLFLLPPLPRARLPLPATKPKSETVKHILVNACGSQLGREKLPELGFSFLQEGVLPLLPLFREVEQPRGVTGQLHNSRLAVFISVEGGLEARDGRGAVGDYPSTPFHSFLRGCFIAPSLLPSR